MKEYKTVFPTSQNNGLSKLEYFAGQALIGILSSPVISPFEFKSLHVKLAYDLAELMIEEAEKRNR
jgi:hypothetical protein